MPTSGSGRVQVVGRGNEKAPRPIQEKKKKKKQSAVEVGFSGLSKQVRRLGTLGGTSAHGGPQLLSESSKARPVRAADRGQSLRLPRGSPVTV